MQNWDLTHAHWFTSSYSGGNTDCVEIAFVEANWHKSSYSSGNTDCVEVAKAATAVGVRDSKNRTAGHLLFPSPAWSALLHTLH